MSTIELKKSLIDKINSIDDKNLLQDIYRLINIEIDKPEIYQLNEEQLNIINEAQEQIKKGIYLTQKEADKETEEWLNE